MNVTFLFLDESVDLDTAWLTGVFVPAEQYADVRDAFIRIIRETLTEAGHEHPHPTELHGAAMLIDIPGITDEHRIKVFEKVVMLVNEAGLEVISVGHVHAEETRRHFRDMLMDPGDKLYYLNFNEMVDAMYLPDDSLVLPVFDGVPRQRQTTKREPQPVDRFAYDAFMLGSQITHWFRIAAEAKPTPWVRHKTNLRNLAEPTFSDSSRSPLLQLADVVGYLLGVPDRLEQKEPSLWKAAVASVTHKIDRTRVHRRLITTHFDGA